MPWNELKKKHRFPPKQSVKNKSNMAAIGCYRGYVMDELKLHVNFTSPKNTLELITSFSSRNRLKRYIWASRCTVAQRLNVTATVVGSIPNRKNKVFDMFICPYKANLAKNACEHIKIIFLLLFSFFSASYIARESSAKIRCFSIFETLRVKWRLSTQRIVLLPEQAHENH